MEDREISVHYEITLQDGALFDTTSGREPVSFSLTKSPFPQGTLKVIESLGVNETSSVSLAAVDAYGERDEGLVFRVSRKKLPEDFTPEVGAVLSFVVDEQEVMVSVLEIDDQQVTLDGNHPLAGQDVTFTFERVA